MSLPNTHPELMLRMAKLKNHDDIVRAERSRARRHRTTSDEEPTPGWIARLPLVKGSRHA